MNRSGGEAVKVSGWRRCSGGGVLLGSAEEGKEAWGGTVFMVEGSHLTSNK